jgi:hypothetical protein
MGEWQFPEGAAMVQFRLKPQGGLPDIGLAAEDDCWHGWTTALAIWSSGSSIGSSQAMSQGSDAYDNLAANYLAFVRLASIPLWLAAR